MLKNRLEINSNGRNSFSFRRVGVALVLSWIDVAVHQAISLSIITLFTADILVIEATRFITVSIMEFIISLISGPPDKPEVFEERSARGKMDAASLLNIEDLSLYLIV